MQTKFEKPFLTQPVEETAKLMRQKKIASSLPILLLAGIFSSIFVFSLKNPKTNIGHLSSRALFSNVQKAHINGSPNLSRQCKSSDTNSASALAQIDVKKQNGTLFSSGHLNRDLSLNPGSSAFEQLEISQPMKIEGKKIAYSNTLVKFWSKSDLKTIKSSPIETIFTRFSRQLSSFMNTVAKKDAAISTKTGFKKLYSANLEIKKEIYFYKLGILEELPVRAQGNGKALAEHVKLQSTITATEKLNGAIPFINKIKAGLNFDLGFGSKTASKNSKRQKYGLILKEIRPASTPSDRVSVSTSMEEELKFAGKSDIVWTIGPVNGKKPNPFNVNYEQFSRIEKKSTWDKISLPTVRFKFRIVPASQNVQQYLGPSDPGFILSATQIENLYMISYATKGKGGKPSATHTFKIPIYGNLEATRIFDTTGKPVMSRLNNILMFDRAPKVDLVYKDPEQFYLLESSHKLGDHKVSFTAERRLINATAKDPERRYKTAYSFGF